MKIWPVIVVLAIAQHFIWAAMLLISPVSFGVTSVRGLNDLFGNHAAIIAILIIVASLALWGLLLEPSRVLSRIILMLPQQFVLLVSAGGALLCMISGTFADGIVRTSPFIITDQLPTLLLAIGHTAAIAQIVLGVVP